MKRGKFEPGDVVELSRSGCYAYCRVLLRDEFGTLFEIFDYVADSSVPFHILDRLQPARKQVVYVNEAAAKKDWRYVGNIRSVSIDSPPMFSGHPSFGWTIYENGKQRRVSAKSTSEDELLRLGYVPRVLWLPKSIEEFCFERKGLRWNWSS
jgi:hypothetical protein